MKAPLETSAPLAHRLARELCRQNPATGENCAWSHGFWPWLRLLGLVTTPDYHADFYRDAFGGVDAGAAGAPRVLVSGAADYAMFAEVLAAFRARGIEPDITVIDVCETPLALSRWYAERSGAAISTERCDILDFQARSPFDAVCSDSFLGRFAPAARQALLAKWREVLRPGGKAITVNRLRPVSAMEPVVFTALEAQAFRDNILRTAASLHGALPVGAQELAQMAGAYALRHHTYSLRSLAELRGLFEAAGFRIDILWAAPVAAGNVLAASGPSVRGNAEYAKLVASRA